MDQAANSVDAENPKHQGFEQGDGSPNRTNSVMFVETAALLTLWSVLVINEGAIRLINTNPSLGLNRPTELENPAPGVGVLFAAGLLEVLFGLVGVFVGVAGLVFRWYSTFVTKIAIVIQNLFGYYVFVVYVFVRPIFKAKDLAEPFAGLSMGESKFLIALGVLTSFHFCLALQGGQFVFFARLIYAGTGRDFLKQKTGNRARAIFWNANFGFSGLWTLITGALIHGSRGGGKLPLPPYMSPPNVGRLPGLTITTGVLILAWAAVGIFLAMSKAPAPWYYFLLSGLVYVFALLNFGIVQFGLIPKNAGAVAMHNGLVYMVVFMGPYFVHLAGKEGVEA